jgi:translocation and assembly module TamB
VSGDIATALRLDGGLQENEWRGRMQPATLHLGDSVWTLTTAIDMVFDSAARQLTPSAHCWQERGVQLCFDQLTIGEAGAAGIDLSGDLVRAAGLLPARFSLNGPVTARVDAQWEDLEIQQLAARLEVGAGELRENLLGGDWTDFNWDYLKFTYLGDPEAGRLQGTMVEGGEERLAADVSMPSARDGPLSGQLVLKGIELQSFENFVDALGQMRGEIGGTLQFSGRVDAPLIDGTLALRDGRATLARSPTTIEDLSLEARFSGSRADLLGQLSLGGGSSQLRGELDWREAPYLQLAMQGSDKQLSIPPKSSVTVTEDLLLDLRADKISLTGELVIPQGQLVIVEVPESAVEVSEDVLLFDGEGNPLQDTSAAPVEIDVTVRIPDQLRVATEGIAGRLGGQLEVRQSPRKPLQLLGRLKIVEGKFELLGPRFRVTRGQLSFVGVPDNPQLDIAMERQITEDQVTVGIRVGGNLELPKLEFYSRPALPEEEVMAYVFGGRKIDRSGDTDSLAMALAMTSGLMQSQGILKGVSLGVEGRDSKARAAIGGYVSDRIYMSYGIGLYTPINTLTVRMDILRNFWLEVVSGLDNSADVYYAWKR